jgi:8-hydroxy-5-deazaflavin:NADPH oxidoreductase
MKIGIVGAGHIGGTLAKLFVDAGHEVAVSNSRGPSSLHEFVSTLGPQAHAMSVDDAASYGDVVILAAPFRETEALPSIERVAGKIVVDAMNAYDEHYEPMDLGDKTSSEITLDRLIGSRLVKAFNTMYYGRLAKDGRPEKPLDERQTLFVAGDDAEAKNVVMQLIEDIGFTPADTGGLREGGKLQQPGGLVYNVDLTARNARALLESLHGGVKA